MTVGLLAAFLSPAISFAAVTTYVGDGLVIRVLDYNEDTGAVRGELVRAGATYPFNGTAAESGGATVVTGTFAAGGKSYDFNSRKEESSESITFTTGGKNYKLSPQDDAPKPDKDADNPLAGGDKIDPKPTVVAPTPTVATVPATPTELHLRRHRLPDISLGVPAAYTAITPIDWRVEGQVEWRPDPAGTPFPQQTFKFTSPQDGRVQFQPAAYFSFMSAPGLGRRDGDPVPNDFPAWLVENLPRYNKSVGNVRLVSKNRNDKLEQMKADMDRQTGAIGNKDGRYEVWMITLEFDENGVRRREESTISFVSYPPFHGLNGFFTQSWALWFGPIVSAPVESFAQQKPMLYFAAGSVQPTLRWFTLEQQIIRENSQRRTAANWEAIRRRGEQINQMPVTPADQQAYDSSLNSDKAQRDRVNTLNETNDYKDVDGSTVNLSIHGKYKFSNGTDIVITDRYLKPGEGYQEINPK